VPQKGIQFMNNKLTDERVHSNDSLDAASVNTFKQAQVFAEQRGFALFRKSRKRKVYMVMWSVGKDNFHTFLSGDTPVEKIPNVLSRLLPQPKSI